jgi:hypothetical protein
MPAESRCPAHHGDEQYTTPAVWSVTRQRLAGWARAPRSIGLRNRHASLRSRACAPRLLQLGARGGASRLRGRARRRRLRRGARGVVARAPQLRAQRRGLLLVPARGRLRGVCACLHTHARPPSARPAGATCTGGAVMLCTPGRSCGERRRRAALRRSRERTSRVLGRTWAAADVRRACSSCAAAVAAAARESASAAPWRASAAAASCAQSAFLHSMWRLRCGQQCKPAAGPPCCAPVRGHASCHGARCSTDPLVLHMERQRGGRGSQERGGHRPAAARRPPRARPPTRHAARARARPQARPRGRARRPPARRRGPPRPAAAAAARPARRSARVLARAPYTLRLAQSPTLRAACCKRRAKVDHARRAAQVRSPPPWNEQSACSRPLSRRTQALQARPLSGPGSASGGRQ